MLGEAEAYKWSSYSMFVGLDCKQIIKPQNIVDYFRSVKCRELYKEFIESAIAIKEKKSFVASQGWEL